jgi:amino acid adenylation domain-containing protein
MSKENIEAIYELSPMQEGMFFHSQYAPQSGVYFQQLSCLLEGQLHADAFQRAWQRVVDRHAILRTAFVSKRLDKPLQVVNKHVNLEIETQDWRDLSHEAQEQRLEEFLREDKKRGFDLSRVPLMRLFLIRLADELYQFVWSHSNMLLDGWSLFLVIKEVFEFYDAFRKGVVHDLPSPAPFKQYIEWLKQQNQGRAERFWARALSGFTEPNTIDIKSETNGQEQVESYCELQLDLSESLTSDLQAFSRKHKLTLNTLIQGAWALLLHLYTDDDDIVFGTTVSGRPPALEKVESMVGLFINTLPLRIAISHDDQVLPWLQRIQSSNVELRDYEYSQLVDVQRKSDVPPGTPLFNSIIVFESYPVDSAINELDTGLKIRSFSFTEQTNYPFTFIVIPGRRMVLKIAFAPREFHPAAVKRMLSHLERILESMIAVPGRKLVSFVAPAEQELQTIRAKLIGTRVEYPLDRCIHELFEQQVERTPDNFAVAFEGQSLTYAQLNRKANQLAHYLRRLGAQAETKVGICLDRSPEMIVAVWGILKAGAAYVPLDPSYPPDRLAYMSEDAGVALLVTKESLADRAQRNDLRAIKLDSDRDLIARESETNPISLVSPENLVYIIYTSGSTGLPKGVMVAHRSLVNYVLSMIPAIGLDPEERFLQFASLSFDASAVQIYPTLLSGATLVLHRSPAELSNLELKEFCEGESVTVLDIPAGFWQQWVEDLSSRDHLLKRSIRFYMTGGESVSVDRVRSWSQMLECPARFLSSYGPTETTIGAMISITESVAASDLKRPNLPLGFALPNIEVHLLDRHLRAVPLGVTGEIYIGGAGLARGYLGRAGQTAEKFVPDGLSGASGRRLYRTGDLGRIVDGELEYLGRVDEQVKVRGYRIELGEIEAELNRQAEVKASAVVLQEEDNGERRLVAYVELREAVAAAELMKRLRERLPEWMVPGVYERVAKLPVSANGKVVRKRLREAASERLATGGEYEQARSGVEEVLAGIWSEVLKVERVGIHDNFFELGGHSLMATQLMSRVRDVLKLEVPMKALFDSPTVAGLSAVIEPQLRAYHDLEVPPLGPVERNSSGPALSFAQQRLWILDQLDPGTPAFNLPAAARLRGPLDAAALERTLNEIVARHEALRTTFGVIAGRPVQLISPSLKLSLPLINLCALEQAERQTYMERLANEELARAFDLTRGPLLRALLIRLEPEQHVFLMTMHHIVSDGWSMIVFLRELAQIYSSFSLAKPSPLPPLAIQYADFAQWQREWLKDEVLEAQLGYWKERLGRDVPVLDLPTDHPRPAIQTFRGGTHTLLIPRALNDALSALSRREGATLFMTLLAAFKTLLYRYCGESDVTIGTPIANRNRSEVEPLIGFFLNTLVLRTDLSGNPSFRELLARVRDVALGAYAHQDIPFELLLEQLQPERDLSRTPFFQVMFNMMNFFSSSTINLPGLVVEGFSPFEASAKFDLNLYASKQENGLRLDFIYNRDLFERETIEQMANQFRNLLQAVATNPRYRLSEIPLLTEANRKEIALRAIQCRPTNPFKEFRQDEIDQTISARFEQQVEQYPDNVAVQTRECSLTYRELNTWANNVAATLPAGATPGTENIALVFEPGATTIVTILAALKAGKTYVPADPHNPIDRLHLILDDSQASAIVTDTRNLSLSERLSNGRLPIINVDEVDRAVDVGRLPEAASPDSHAYILYTSGSTGQPKGVVQNHRNVLFHIRNYTNNLHISANDRLTLLSSYGFDAAVMDIFGALLNGATLCPFAIRDEGLAGFYQWLLANQITIYHSTPTVYRYFLDSLTGHEQFPDIRLVVLGGEEVYKRDVDLFKQYFAPNCIFVNGLGPTESTVSLQYFVTKHTPVERATVPVGYPVEGTEVVLLSPAPEHTEVYGIGEIAIRSPHVALGYWRRPELTRSAFTQDRGDRYRRTYCAGDLGRLLPDGSIGFVGRRDQQVKIRGYRIEPGEVESALTEHPLIKEATVIARNNGNGEKQLAAYLVPRERAQVSAEQIRSFLKEKLPAYMVPAQFTMLQSLPLTTTGKVDRQALSKIEPEHVSASESGLAPRTPVEEVMAAVWSDVLRREGVGIQDNFFELGGHSLLATQVLSRVRDAFNVELPLRSIFENPTIANLSREVEAARVAQTPPRIPLLGKLERNGEIPLSFSQQRLWFLDQLEPGNPAYTIHAAVRLLGDLDPDLLKRSLEAVIERHEVLRTTFPEVDDRALQRIGPPLSLTLPVVDLDYFAAEEREAQALSLIIEESQRPFDLAVGPLLRTKLLRMNERDHILIVTIHHIVSDAWSMGILVRDAAAFYKSFAEHSAISLPELQLQYADYATWQREWLQPERLAESLDYWRRQLGDKALSMRLPTDKPRPSAQTYNGALYQVELSEALSSEVENLSRRESVSVFMTLLSAFKVILSRYTGSEDIVVGTDVANRSGSEVEGLIGMFVNQLVLRSDLSGNPTFKELLGRVREVALEAYAHQETPFDKLVEAIKPDRELDRNPLFQVMFGFQNAPTQPIELPGLSIGRIGIDNKTSVFDLSLYMTRQGGKLMGSMRYNTDLFEPHTIGRILDAFKVVLQTVEKTADIRLDALFELIENEERAQVLAKEQELEQARIQTFTKVRRKSTHRRSAETVAHDLATVTSSESPSRVA